MLFKKILKYINMKRQAAILMVAVVSTLIGASTPVLYGIIIDKVLVNREYTAFFGYMLIYLGLIVTEITLGYVQNCIVLKTGEQVALCLRRQLYDKISSLDYIAKNKYGAGNIISLYNSDVFQVTNLMARFVYDIVLQVVTILVIVVMMFAMNVKLAVALLLMIPLFFVIFMRLGKATQAIVKIRQEDLVQINSRLQEDIKGSSFLQIPDCIRYRHRRMDELFTEFFRINYKMTRMSGFVGQLGTLLASLADVLVLALGGYLYMHNGMSIGVIITFEAYAAHLFSPILSLVSLNQIAHIAKPSLERIFGFLELKSVVKQYSGTQELTGIIQEIRLEDVTFAYENKNVLEHLNLTIRPNTLHFLIGESGCGKSTVCLLLSGLMPVQDGCVTVNQQNIHIYTTESVRKRIYYLHQESILYHCSLRENIEMGQHFSDSEIMQVLEQVCMTKIGDRPVDLDMQIEANGDSLSGGEKRRLVLARALIRKYDVYILDEPTSGLDPAAANMLIHNLKEQTAERTFIVVSHNPEEFMFADTISVIANGRTVMEGDYQQLTKQDMFDEMLRVFRNTDDETAVC